MPFSKRKTRTEAIWWKCNDLNITLSDENEVENLKNAMILFYQLQIED